MLLRFLSLTWGVLSINLLFWLLQHFTPVVQRQHQDYLTHNFARPPLTARMWTSEIGQSWREVSSTAAASESQYLETTNFQDPWQDLTGRWHLELSGWMPFTTPQITKSFVDNKQNAKSFFYFFKGILTFCELFGQQRGSPGSCWTCRQRHCRRSPPSHILG